MNIKSEVIQYSTPDGDEIEITVRRATAIDGVRRNVLKTRMQDKWSPVLKENSDTEFRDFMDAHPEWLIETTVYPSTIAATESVKGIPWPLTAEQFCNLPDDLVDLWTMAAYRLNPHWEPDYEARMPMDEKKKDTRTSGTE